MLFGLHCALRRKLIISSVERCGRETPPCDVIYGGLGAFPSKKHPKVIWFGCEEKTGTLLSLRKRIEGELLPLGFKAEERPFHPHVTLARVRSERNTGNLISLLENRMLEPRTVEIGEIQLMKSRLNPGGSVYSIVHSTQLQPAKQHDGDAR